METFTKSQIGIEDINEQAEINDPKGLKRDWLRNSSEFQDSETELNFRKDVYEF